MSGLGKLVLHTATELCFHTPWLRLLEIDECVTRLVSYLSRANNSPIGSTASCDNQKNVFMLSLRVFVQSKGIVKDILAD